MSESSTAALRKVNEKWLFCVDAFTFDQTGLVQDKPTAPIGTGMLGLMCSDMHDHAERGDSTLIAQFYELVIHGTILAKHVFKGLQRPLRTDGDSKADEQMLIYTRKPTYDAVWIGGRNGYPKRVNAPPGKVFTVIVMPNTLTKHKEKYPEIAGWINHWAWVEEDQALPEASREWVDRYKIKLWTREN